MYGLKRSHWVVVQSCPSAHCRVRSRRRRRPWSIRRHWPTPRVPEPEKDLAADAAVEKKMAATKDRGDSSSSPQLLTVPSGRIMTRSNGNRPFEEIAPFCVSANDVINPLPPSLFYGLGWYAHHPSGSGGDALIMAAHYWYSALPTSKLRMPFPSFRL